ncbi:hypothetical protein L6R53_31310 [Myxococcota bacterium]|nr:hypothetical protein [Myxococcota bacterium]
MPRLAPLPRLLPLLAAALLPACHIGGGDRSWSFPDQVDGVDVRLSNGSITALPAPDGIVRIDWSGGGLGNQKIHPDPVVTDGVVWLDALCGATCGGDITVWLPPGVDFSAQLDKGDVAVELPARADLRACAAMGSVWLEVPAGAWDLQVDVGVGELWVEGVNHDPTSPERIEACVATGDLEILGT